MKRKLVYCIATLFVAMALFLIFPKGSEEEHVSKDNSDSIVQGDTEANSYSPASQKIIDRFKNAKITVGGPSKLPKHITYIDEEMADEIGLDRHERVEVERIIDYYKNEMDQINLNNATISSSSDNTFLIKVSKAGEQGLEVSNLLKEEILLAIGEDKFKRFIDDNEKSLANYFFFYGQSARTLEIEIKPLIIHDNSGEVVVSEKIAEIKHTFEDFGFWRGTRQSLNKLGNYAAVTALIDRSDI